MDRIAVVSHSNSTSNHNTQGANRSTPRVVSHSNSTSNHNLYPFYYEETIVVSHSNSTSNHNSTQSISMFTGLFLIPILHQTTTLEARTIALSCCFSFQFYIKPQPADDCLDVDTVVSHSNSTSNHNSISALTVSTELFLIPILHQTTTPAGDCYSEIQLFLIPILHQTTTVTPRHYVTYKLFLIPILHQTTTSDSILCAAGPLFLIPILHQTTTSRMAVIHILHVTHMTPMHKTSCRTPGKLVGCNFVFQRAIYQKNSSC